MTTLSVSPPDQIDEERHDFIHLAAAVATVGAAGMVAYLLIEQMNAAGDTKAASSLEIDISKIPLGGEIRVLIGRKPFFLRHRTPAKITSAASADIEKLPDPQTDE